MVMGGSTSCLMFLKKVCTFFRKTMFYGHKGGLLPETRLLARAAAHKAFVQIAQKSVFEFGKINLFTTFFA